MEKYEKAIGLKTIFLTLVRRLHIVVLIFVPVALAAFVVTNKFLTKTYQSTVSMSRGTGTVVTTPQHNAMQSYIKDTTVNEEEPEKSGAITIAVKTLAEQNITITAGEILSGLSFATMANNSASFSFSYTSTKESLVQPVLKAVSEAAQARMRLTTGDYKNAKIVSAASAAKKISNEKKYFLIALAADFVVALGVPFVIEIVADEVYDKEDVELLGCPSFDLKASKK